jgi:hypothetical protein
MYAHIPAASVLCWEHLCPFVLLLSWQGLTWLPPAPPAARRTSSTSRAARQLLLLGHTSPPAGVQGPQLHRQLPLQGGCHLGCHPTGTFWE